MNTINKNFLINMFLLIFITLICCFFSEIITRIYLKIYPDKNPPYIPVVLNSDKCNQMPYPYLPYVLKPGRTIENYSEAQKKTIRYKINQFGYIGSNNVQIPKPSNVYRILFLGGSTTFNPGSEYDMDWPHQVCSLLNEYDLEKTVEAVNMGLGGYTSMENLIDYLIRGEKFQADVIVIYQGLNELYWAGMTDNIQRDYSHFRDQLVVYKPNIFNKLPVFTQSKSYMLLRYNLIKIFGSPIDTGVTVKQFPKKKFDPEVLSIFKRNIQDIVWIAKKNNQNVLLISQVLDKDYQEDSEFRKLVFNCNKLFTKSLENLAEEEDVSFLNAADLFSIEKGYFYDEMHFTDIGLRKFSFFVSTKIMQDIMIIEE